MSTNFDSFVAGKTVALIGGSDDIEWDIVNSCDIVARVNGHWVRQRGRCDLLYYSCADDLDYRMWEEEALWQELKFVMLNHTPRLFGGIAGEIVGTVLNKLIHRKVQYQGYLNAPSHAWTTFAVLRDQSSSYSWARGLAARYDFHPLTGVLAVEHLLLSGIKSLYVTGMSLYQQTNGELPKEAGRHYIPPQFAFFKDAAKNPLLKLSPCLSLLVNK